MQPELRQLLQSGDVFCQKYNSPRVALAQNAVCARWLAGFKMAARVREELTSLRRWLLLPLPRSGWLSRQSLMSQPWAGLPSKLRVLCQFWCSWLHWKQSLFVRQSGLTLEPGYLLVITTKAINFPLPSCPGKDRVRPDVCDNKLKLRLKVAYRLIQFVFFTRLLHDEYNKSWFITVHVISRIWLLYIYLSLLNVFEWQ